MAAPQAVPRKPLEPGAALRALWQPWRELHLWPPVSWLMPTPLVRLLQADGGESLWEGDERPARDAGRSRAARHVAVELPEPLRLERRLALPPMPSPRMHEAVALEVRSASPFDAADLVWGWRAAQGRGGKTVDVTVVLASRRAVEGRLQSLAERIAPGAAPEVWALAGPGLPIVVQGFGEAARQRSAARGRVAAYALLALAIVLAAAAATTPTVQLKLRAAQATLASQQADQQMAPLVAQRESLVRGQEAIAALREQMQDHVEALAVIELLTQLFPDDTYLQRVQVQGAKVTVSGQTPNAAALMNQLGGHPGVRDVRAPAAATRSMAAGRENFTVEWTLAPELLRPTIQAARGKAKP